MKKIKIIIALAAFVSILSGCASAKHFEENSNTEITQFYASNDEDCNFIFEFYNESEKILHIVNYISETNKMENQYVPVLTSQDITLKPGQGYIFKLNADRMLKIFKKGYSVAINCYEKEWHWGYSIEKDMKYRRVRVIVTNDSNEGGKMIYPPFNSENKFIVQESAIDHNGKPFFAYDLIDTQEGFGAYFDTRVFFVDRNGKFSNIFPGSCKEVIEELLNKKSFMILNFEGGKYIMLNTNPLDLEDYLLKSDYDFIYEIINNTSGPITVANVMLTEDSRPVGWTEDVVIEKGKTYQFNYDLKTLQKIYGSNAVICTDVKTESSEWFRGWFGKLDWYNQKYSVYFADGTEGRTLDGTDLRSDILFARELDFIPVQ